MTGKSEVSFPVADDTDRGSALILGNPKTRTLLIDATLKNC